MIKDQKGEMKNSGRWKNRRVAARRVGEEANTPEQGISVQR
jgi:hypothetical protein